MRIRTAIGLAGALALALPAAGSAWNVPFPVPAAAPAASPEAAAPAGAPKAAGLSDFESALVERINALRSARGLRLLAVSPKLGAAALDQARSMGAHGYFSHASADGRSFASRIQSFYPRTSRRWTVGENLCMGDPGDLTAADCVGMWVDSPEHLRNLLDPNWREIGVSAIDVAGAPGEYGDLDTTIVAAEFGARG
jgi:uncharacterized protein YkwD